MTMIRDDGLSTKGIGWDWVLVRAVDEKGEEERRLVVKSQPSCLLLLFHLPRRLLPLHLSQNARMSCFALNSPMAGLVPWELHALHFIGVHVRLLRASLLLRMPRRWYVARPPMLHAANPAHCYAAGVCQ
jgi:hypothetical protein